MSCTEHLSCRLAGKREVDAYTEEAERADGSVFFRVKIGTDTLAALANDRVNTRFGRWEATAGGNAVPLSEPAQQEFFQAVRETVSAVLHAAFMMRMSLHG